MIFDEKKFKQEICLFHNSFVKKIFRFNLGYKY